MNTGRPIRVLHMGSPSGLYGAERWILALVKYLPSASVESVVSVLKDAPHYTAALCEHAAALGARSHIFEAYGKLSLSAVTQLRRYVREQRIDIVHTHGYKTDLVGLLGVSGTSCRIVSTPHGWSADAGFMLQCYEALDRWAFPFMDAVAPLSEDLTRELTSIPRLRRKLHFIRNGVDLSEVENAPPSCPELASYRERGEFLFGYIGQLIPRKGIDGLIRAFASLQGNRARLCLVGEGPQRAELEVLSEQLGVRERVHFFGYRPDRLTFLKSFDTFVLPSSLEGIPRCVLEAMAAQVAVIATDIPGCRDVVRDGATGLLTPVGDVPKLAAALGRVVADNALRLALAQAGRQLVQSEFSADTMALRYVELYRAVLANRSMNAGTSRPGTQVVE